ncbi:MAG: phage holin family protein [Lachnospiraceae bacterium]|nr:phage holin family protein [Lachnospiraceae bacterium]
MAKYLKKLFQVDFLFLVSGAGTLLYKFLFPQKQYFYGAAAVLVIMILDLCTKLFSLSRQGGGVKVALVTHKISSSAFARGTTDKLLVFGIMLIICGCAYRLTVIDAIAVWFTQMVYTLMFLRDLLSILENLNDAGVGGLKIFKKAVEKKMVEYVEDYKEEYK